MITGGDSRYAEPGALLPQPGGFEGFGAMLVERGRDHLAVAEFPDESRVRNPFPFHAAASAFCADVMPHDDLAARPDRVLDRRKLESLERLHVGGCESKDLLVTAVDALLESDRAREVKDPVGVRELSQGVEIAFAKGRVSQPHEFHVLLRDRLLPQPHGFEGVSAVEKDLDARDLPAHEVVDVSGRQLLAEIDAARPARRARTQKSEHALCANRLHALESQREVRTSVAHIGEEAPDRVTALIDPAELGPWRAKFDVIRAAGEVRLDITRIECR